MIVGIAVNRFLPDDETWEVAEEGMRKYVEENLVGEGQALFSLPMFRDSWTDGDKQIRRLNGLAQIGLKAQPEDTAEEA